MTTPKYLTGETTFHLRQVINEINGAIALANSIPDPKLSASIVSKMNARLEIFKSQYAEVENEDGSVLVKHPGIGFVTVEEKLCEEPVRLFASKVKSLSTNRLCVYHADALIQAEGSVEYVNRVLLLDVEMTQAEFASLIANPGRGAYPMTIREKWGVPITFEGDLNDMRAKLMFDATQEMTEDLAKWVGQLVQAAGEAAAKGGVMSKGARDGIIKDVRVLTSWTEQNPAFFAERLAEFTANTACDMKLEVMSAQKLMEDKQ